MIITKLIIMYFIVGGETLYQKLKLLLAIKDHFKKSDNHRAFMYVSTILVLAGWACAVSRRG